MATRSAGDGGTRRSIRILCVDDSQRILDLTADYLSYENESFVVETATGPGEALEHDLAAVDCIVSDYRMPGTDGIEFLRSVREKYPDLPFVLFTGEGSEEVASEALSAGATNYFRKDSGTDRYAVLANWIEEAVGKRRAQRRSRRGFEAIETAREGIGVVGADGRFRYVNEAYAELYGYTPDELVGTGWERLYPDEEVHRGHDEILPTADSTGYWRGRTVGLRTDGTTFPEDHVVTATESGEYVCSVRDATESDTRAVRRYETLVETLDEAVYAVDHDGRFRYANGAFVELVGYDRDRLYDSSPALVKSEAGLERAERALRRLLSDDGPETTRFEVEIHPREGEPVVCEDRMAVVPYEGALFDGSVGVLRPVEDRD
jgi:PAS domain S-box-containing protein